MNAPIFSIKIPMYKVADYVIRCIEIFEALDYTIPNQKLNELQKVSTSYLENQLHS